VILLPFSRFSSPGHVEPSFVHLLVSLICFHIQDYRHCTPIEILFAPCHFGSNTSTPHFLLPFSLNVQAFISFSNIDFAYLWCQKLRCGFGSAAATRPVGLGFGRTEIGFISPSKLCLYRPKLSIINPNQKVARLKNLETREEHR
jgi:hypothetical protein